MDLKYGSFWNVNSIYERQRQYKQEKKRINRSVKFTFLFCIDVSLFLLFCIDVFVFSYSFFLTLDNYVITTMRNIRDDFTCRIRLHLSRPMRSMCNKWMLQLFTTMGSADPSFLSRKIYNIGLQPIWLFYWM